jgi:hypothetical protein
MDWLTILGIVGGVIALFGAGRISATWPAAAKAKAEKIAQTVGQDLRNIESQIVSGPHGSWSQVMAHPVDTIEQSLADHHASVAENAVKALMDSVAAKSKNLDVERKVLADLSSRLGDLFKTPAP